jgi:type VI secretion system secreted protein VgrG
MADYKQAERPLQLTTPLGPDKLFLRGFTGREGISELFRFDLDLIADSKTEISFDAVLGKHFTIRLRLAQGERQFDGICMRFAQGERDPRNTAFTAYRAEIVPQFWLLTRKAQSRIFQHMTVPDILKKVLTGLDVDYQIKGTFEPRNFCVQYRESDFNFASRLMEEEGIFYFFKHSDGSHKMVVANTPDAHADVPGKSTITYERLPGGFRDDDRIADWEKVQELRSGKYTLWDHCFELPHKHLDADKTILPAVQAGKVSHKLTAGDNAKLELYDWPGEYAQRFDGVDKGGGDRPSDVQKIFQDNKRTVEIRMQQEALSALLIRGGSNCRQLTSGHKFTLEKHFNGDGQYVLTSVRHTASGAGDYRGGETGAFHYENRFECIPVALPFRPLQVTPKPVVQGSQTAVVVGPAGEEIFTDKYSRVKVQFHWDREGKHDSDSSCWIRVSTHWAGKQWGIIHIPRIGQEVVVDFLEGDPDQPIIVGSVYNADMMPPYALPANKTESGVKSRSSLGGSPSNFNEVRFEDKKGSELLTIHAERNQSISVEADESHTVGHDRTKTIDHDETTHVKHDRTETVDNNETITILGNRTEMVAKDETITIGMNRTESVAVNESVTIGVARTETVGAAETITVGGARAVTVGGVQTYTFGAAVTMAVGGSMSVQVGGDVSTETSGSESAKVSGDRNSEVSGDEKIDVSGSTKISSGDEISLSCGASSIVLKKDGTVEIQGVQVKISGSGTIDVKAGGKMGLQANGMMQAQSTGIMMLQGSLVKIN